MIYVCQQCCAQGALPLAHTKKRNGATNAHRAQRARLTAPAPQADVDVISVVGGSVLPPSMPFIAPHVSKRRRRGGSIV